MKKTLKGSLFLILLSIGISAMGQATFQTKASGTYTAVATWTITAGSDGDGNNWPDANDDVIILNTYTVTYSTAQSVKNLTINTGGKLSSTGSPTLSIFGTSIVNNGELSGSGHLAFKTTATAISGPGTFSTSGNWGFEKTTTIASDVVATNIANINLTTNGTYTVTNNGSLTTSGFLSIGLASNSGVRTWINASNSNLSVARMSVPSGKGILIASATGNTITYTYGTSSINIANPASSTYYNLSVTNGNTKALTVNTIVTGNLSIGSNTTLNANNHDINIGGDIITASGSDITNNTGLLTFNGAAGAQVISGSIANISCNDVLINNSAGVTTSCPFTINGTITASSGTFTTGTTPIYIPSALGSTGRIGDCTGGNISGSKWFMERYIEAADSGWQDISCPINGANISSWDSTLYMSLSPSCPDGISLLDDGSQFYSFAYWNVAGTGAWSNVIDCSEALSQARGYEMWLATDLISFDPTTIRTIGTPNVGTINTTIGDAAGEFALVGNPYMSPILWGSVLTDNSNVQDYFQVYDDILHTYAIWDESDGDLTSTGKLNGSNGVIPAYQGFWIENANTTSTFTFKESHKTTSALELYKKQNLNKNIIRLKIYSKAMPNAHESIIKFNENATPYYDAYGDASFLPSRDKKSPSITPLTPDDRRLVVSSYPMHEEILNIPIAVTTGAKGDYLIDFKNINSVTAYSCMVLEDVSAKKLIPLNSDFTYSFTSDDINGSKKDFILHCYNNSSSCRTTTTSPLEPIVIVNENGVNAYFNFEQSTPTSIQVYNVVGQNMLNISKEIYHDVLPMELKKSNSVYFIQITTADNTYTKKIIY